MNPGFFKKKKTDSQMKESRPPFKLEEVEEVSNRFFVSDIQASLRIRLLLFTHLLQMAPSPKPSPNHQEIVRVMLGLLSVCILFSKHFELGPRVCELGPRVCGLIFFFWLSNS
jgi:hypothetical protein